MNSSPPVQPSEERQMFEAWTKQGIGAAVWLSGLSYEAAWTAWQARAALSASNEDVRDARRLKEAVEKLLAAMPYANDGRSGFSIIVTSEAVEACRFARAAIAAQEGNHG